MPRKEIVKKQNLKLLKSILIVCIICFIISASVDIGMYIYKMDYVKKTTSQQQKINDLIGAKVDANIINVVDSKVEYRKEILRKINNNKVNVAQFINKQQNLMPKDISLQSMLIKENKKVQIIGKGDKAETILDFYNKLKSNYLNTNIAFNKIEGAIGDKEGKAGLKFSFSFSLADDRGDNVNESK